MLLQIVFTNLFISLLYFLSEASNELNQETPYQTYIDFKTKITNINADQKSLKSDLDLIKSHQHTIKTDEGLIKEDLKMLNKAFTGLEDLIKKFKQKTKESIPRSCAEALFTSKLSGIYEIQIPWYSVQPFMVACEAETRHGNWTIILRRMDGSVDFNRKWAEYKEGFGNLTGEFFLGLDKIHALTSDQPQELIVLLEDIKGIIRHEAYDKFAIADEHNRYNLETLGRASGTAGDSLRHHQGMDFLTHDGLNNHGAFNCAHYWTSGWWYYHCNESKSNLMGTYNDTTSGKGMKWDYGDDKYSLKRAVMMLRPRTDKKRFVH